MKRFLPAGVAALAVLIGLAACSTEMKRGSAKSLYTVADTLEVQRGDIGKDIQLKRDQNLLFRLANDPDEPGKWELTHYEPRILLLLSETPRVGVDNWGLLLRANALGYGKIILRFTPEKEGSEPREVKFDISVRH